MLGLLSAVLIRQGGRVVGCIVPELLPSTGNVPWFEAGATIFGPKGIQYLGIPGLINAKNIVFTLIVQVQYNSMQKLVFTVRPVIEPWFVRNSILNLDR